MDPDRRAFLDHRRAVSRGFTPLRQADGDGYRHLLTRKVAPAHAEGLSGRTAPGDESCLARIPLLLSGTA